MTTEPSLPRHVAIIMDGNNRWAKRNGLPGISGHKAGKEAVRKVVEGCVRKGVDVLTLFAFSSENWRRPKDEVSALMELFLIALKNEVKKLHKNNVRLKVIGDITAFNSKLQKYISESEQLTARNTGLTLVIAANYGGQWDIVQATKILAEKVKTGEMLPEDITETAIAENLSTTGLPFPDLCIRSAGEQRISNFLLWQLAYTEFYFTNVLWPDFDESVLEAAFISYSHRVRRFGKTDDQLTQVN